MAGTDRTSVSTSCGGRVLRTDRGEVGAPKTGTSRRTVPLSEEVARTLNSLRVSQKKRDVLQEAIALLGE